ncbi:uncharacterized protein LOC134526042 isoform X2 [Chroicocephalus ridibundus]|uniref:uncharacterized protein LOC134526042 isoform X2 n=1 Tax=Chroicocephalus ridibundus TaxID=1192867 RepID=UPI002FDDDBE3
MAAGGSLAAAGLLWLCLGESQGLGKSSQALLWGGFWVFWSNWLLVRGGGGVMVGLEGNEPPLAPTAPAALLRLHQPQPVLVVEPEKPVEIICEADESMESKAKVSWYRHGKDGPRLVVACDNETSQEFSCKFGGHKVTLHIPCARPNNTGLYLCAYRGVRRLEFGSGTALLVGDSWREQSWVRVLGPPGDPRAPPSLVCAVGATTGPVLVSWPGEAGRVLGLGGRVELLISPVGTTQGGGGLCEVRFNASGPVVRRSVELRKAEGDQPETPMPPVSQENEGQLTYAQLTFATPGTAHAMTHSRMR